MEQTDGKLTMDGRRKLTLTGAKEVIRFDEDAVELNTGLGSVLIEGEELKLKCLSLDTGTVVVEGQLRSFAYEEPRRKRGRRL